MKVTRLLLANQEEIQNAKLFNQRQASEGQASYLFMEVPKPEWEEVPFNFVIRNVQSYYIEPESKDIIANVMYDGLIRMKYEPILENKLELYLSLWQ